jgi:hypothetical protein
MVDAKLLAAPRSIGEEGVDVRIIIQFHHGRVVRSSIAALAIDGARLPRSI